MAYKTRDYSSGSPFVPSGSFGPAAAKPKGDSTPVANTVSGADVVQRGQAFGGVREYDGSIDTTKVHQKRGTKGKAGMWPGYA